MNATLILSPAPPIPPMSSFSVSLKFMTLQLLLLRFCRAEDLASFSLRQKRVISRLPASESVISLLWFILARQGLLDLAACPTPGTFNQKREGEEKQGPCPQNSFPGLMLASCS